MGQPTKFFSRLSCVAPHVLASTATCNRWSHTGGHHFRDPNRWMALFVCCATLMRCTPSRQVSHISSHTHPTTPPTPTHHQVDKTRAEALYVHTYLAGLAKCTAHVFDMPKMIPLSTPSSSLDVCHFSRKRRKEMNQVVISSTMDFEQPGLSRPLEPRKPCHVTSLVGLECRLQPDMNRQCA